MMGKIVEAVAFVKGKIINRKGMNQMVGVQVDLTICGKK